MKVKSRLKVLVDYQIKTWTDVNHTNHTLDSCLYNVEGTVKELNATV